MTFNFIKEYFKRVGYFNKLENLVGKTYPPGQQTYLEEYMTNMRSYCLKDLYRPEIKNNLVNKICRIYQQADRNILETFANETISLLDHSFSLKDFFYI